MVGVQASSLVALGSSAASRGAVAGALLGTPAGVVAASGGLCALVAGAVAAAVAGAIDEEHRKVKERAMDSDQMGSPTGVGGAWLLLAHRYGPVACWRFETEEEARAVFEKGGEIRRMLVELTDEPVTNAWGQTNRWREIAFGGSEDATHVDDEMRAVARGVA